MGTSLGPRPLDDTVAALRSTRVLGSLDDGVLRSIAEAAEWEMVEAGEAVCEQGAPADALYLLISGRLSVVTTTEHGIERMVGHVYPGEPVGEMALLSDERRSATVRALRDSVLLRLDQSDFRQLIPQHPAALLALNRLLIERLHDLLQGRRSKVLERVIAVVPACPGAPVRALSTRLTELPGARRLRVIDATHVREALGTATIGPLGPHDRVASWLEAQEATGDTLLLVGDAEDEAWTRRCLRHADRILFVGVGTASPGGLPWSEVIANRTDTHARRRRDLALVHPDDAVAPSPAGPWLDTLDVDLHHHVRLGVRPDIKRLRRFICGEAVGLSLSGGAARGLAHLGVLRALEELQVPVDFVCGTSMGAIVGSQLALGLSAAAARASTKRGFGSWKIFDWTLPVTSACGGRWFEAHLRATFGDRGVEDLWLPFRCVSASLIRAQPVVHRRGPVWRAVLASSALPGVFPPIVEGDDLLADGVLLDNLPVHHAVEAGCGHIIAVNVINTLDTTMASGMVLPSEPLQRLAERLLPGAGRRTPGLTDYVLRSFFLPTLRDIEGIRRKSDLYIEPPVNQFHYLDVRPFDEIVEVGYGAARERLAAWLAQSPSVPRR
ncbi:patatin-like phospholipase family protein [Chondromyces crocatus]|uniref:Uncharacterized protein n=1 Tax=Chondromyces crocatus TaxID=52 RepID=A0A0K1EJ39_CHOCO|nr:patatin-like phospholipase family protein [Chondromyces crocatus]AKT40884.1 uncharacterized protein CMC5_050410 [Chondromyces crocatus]